MRPLMILDKTLQRGLTQRSRKSKLVLRVLLTALALNACSLPPTRVGTPSRPDARLTQTGIASWYGPGFHGKPTASGVIYDQNDLTAAHQTLPLGSRVLVTNLQNGKAIEVTINDRGPFVKDRIIDLSYAAGTALGMITPGTVPVHVDVIATPYKIRSIRSSLDYTVQVGSFSRLENAQQVRDRLASLHTDAAIVPLVAQDAILYRVRLGTFSDRAAAEELARQVARHGFPVMVVEK